MTVSTKIQQNISSSSFDGEGLFQAHAKGTGIVVLNSPVPEAELIVYELAAGEKLSVDSNFAFVKMVGVSFQAEKSGKCLFQSVTRGEILLQTFTDPSIVRLAPTQGIYEKIKSLSAAEITRNNPGSMSTHT